MSKSDYFENALLLLIFNGTPIANVADNAASSPLTNLYLSLHTADPSEGGSQTTNEATYTSYARIAVPRDNTGFTVTGNTVNPAIAIDYAAATGGSNLTSHFGIGTNVSGAGRLLYSGTLSPNVSVTAGVQPRMTTATAITED